ncbi:hypothetical protein BLNAU_4128 [Blattamonas nauphoetae]|uniref:Uncharacterized protein n=1 Tax=Blattamonas nauphoetae TaxID=2049346 RepID=A0ABQ9YBK0_9EUKA|nr:hypothetical protein BLNAU_4128 [Blattamonas nauphoetae]
MSLPSHFDCDTSDSFSATVCGSTAGLYVDSLHQPCLPHPHSLLVRTPFECLLLIALEHLQTSCDFIAHSSSIAPSREINSADVSTPLPASSLHARELATMKLKPTLDDSLAAKALKFLKSVNRHKQKSADAILNKFEQTSDNPMTEFVQSIVVLISSPSQIITTAAMEMLENVILKNPPKVRLSLIKADLMPHLILTLNPLSLSFTEAVDIHTSLMGTILNTVRLATPDGLGELAIKDENGQRAVHETILRQVVVPSEKYIWHLYLNRFSIIDEKRSTCFLILLFRLLQISPHYQPTMDCLMNTPVLLMIPSCLTSFENDDSNWYFVHLMVKHQQEWNKKGGDQRQTWRTVQRLLRKEGHEDAIEEKLQKDKHTHFGRWTVAESVEWTNQVGMNLPEHE